MDKVEEIEAAISKLPPKEYRRVLDWLSAREHDRWDEQMDRDSSAGRLDFLFEEAEREGKTGTLREWPPST